MLNRVKCYWDRLRINDRYPFGYGRSCFDDAGILLKVSRRAINTLAAIIRYVNVSAVDVRWW